MNTFTRLEKCLLPPPETVLWNQGNLSIQKYTTTQKVSYCVKNFFAFAGLLIISPLTISYDWMTQANVLPGIRKIPVQPHEPTWPPEQRGFATSLFQTSGLGTKWSATPDLKGKCDWDKWMDEKGHVITPDGFEYKSFFTDILSDPTSYIQMLKSHNVTAHRFSLEWSVIEPAFGEIDENAVRLYRNFIQKLIQAGISPSITLSHFVVPEWFYESGNFQTIENIHKFVSFGLKAVELFPEVKDFWSFNELGVKAFQQAREVYPTDIPEGSILSKRVYAAGIATRNMIIAHCMLHTKMATLHPDKKLGVTHQWLKFDMASGNLLEKLFRYFFEKFGFQPVYQFFKDGHFSFEFPFMANIHFVIPKEEFEKNDHFLMRLGVQAYPKALLKMGLNYGQKHPIAPGCIQNQVVTLGACAEVEGTIMRFGPRWNSEAMDEILDEAFAITDQIFITEYGSDARVYQSGKSGFEFDDMAQANYLKQLTERIQSYSIRHKREIKGIFCWSDLRRQMEWENGLECRLATINPVLDKNRHMVGWHSTAASEYLSEAYKKEGKQAKVI